jgi:hypothetical protein
MSASKLDTSGIFESESSDSPSLRTQLLLGAASVRIRKNGIEFRSDAPISPWTEMTVGLQSPRDGRRLNCTGVVVACEGSRHTGYVVSLLFMNLSRQSLERLNQIADGALG